MQSRATLGIAIVAGTLAVALVAVDTAYGLRVRLDARADGGWETVARAPREPYGRYEPQAVEDCPTGSLRGVIDNHKPFPDRVEIGVRFYNATGVHRFDDIPDETATMEAWEKREIAIDVPSGVFAVPAGRADDPKPAASDQITVELRADSFIVTTCVRRET